MTNSPAMRTDRQARSLLFSLLRQTRWPLAIAGVACVVNGISSVWLIATVNKALTATETELARLAWMFVGICLLTLVSRVLGSLLFARLSQGTMSRLRQYVSRRVSGASYRHTELLGAARAQAIVTEDATNVSMFFVALPNLVMHGSIVLGCLIYLAWLSLPTFAAACAVILLGSLGYRLGDSKAIDSLNRAGREQDRLFQHFSSLFFGAKELKLNTGKADAFLTESIDPAIDAVSRHRTVAFSAYAMGVGWILFLVYIFIGAVVFQFTGFSDVSATSLAGYVIVFLFMLVPLDGLLNNIPTINEARVSLLRLDQFIAELPNPESAATPAALAQQNSFSSIRLSGLAHTYYHEKEDGFFTLGPLDLTFAPGELTFLIGGNGSGKTTLAKLLVGLYVPESGVMELDGVPVTDGNRIAYRQLFSAVFSDFHLFESLLGVHLESLDERANALLKKLHLDHKVQVSNGRFSTRALSQGQRKRLALVAAYLEDRPFYIFDEWAADQDPVFKAVFYQELLPELKANRKAVLVITHDDRYFHLADHCLKMENGQLLQSETNAAMPVMAADLPVVACTAASAVRATGA
jgi:putative ATP-binding cassette transporter